MPYHFDTDSIDKKMFILQMLVCGSENYCSHYALAMDVDGGNFGWDHYFFRLKGIVSEIVIETSIKARMLADFIDKNYEYFEVESRKLLEESLGDHHLGYVLEGKVDLNLREAFNKIVHATEMTLAYDSQEGESGPYQTWTGTIELEGSYRSKDWLVGIELFRWSRSVQQFIHRIDCEIEWPNVYLHDR